jgi:hypothetical protein
MQCVGGKDFMFQVQKFKPLAYMLENVIFFCIGQAPKEIEQRKTDLGDVEIFRLASFRGILENPGDIDLFRDANSLSWLERQARSEKKIYVLVASTLETLQVAYATMRGWCVVHAAEIESNFVTGGLLPLIPQPKRPRK